MNLVKLIVILTGLERFLRLQLPWAMRTLMLARACSLSPLSFGLYSCYIESNDYLNAMHEALFRMV